MRATISKSEIEGKAAAPPSKSYTLRGLMCAALARGESEIVHPLSSDDTEAATEVLGKIGIQVVPSQKSWRVVGGDFRQPKTELFCRESAATLRFMTAICSLVPGECRLKASPTLAVRPIRPLLQALNQLGVDCRYQPEKASVIVREGKLKGGIAELPGNISSQFVSALLLIAPFAEEGMAIRLTTPLESKPYVLMTMECLETFGIKVNASKDLRQFEVAKQSYRPARYVVEGDWSSASYLLALGALAGDLEVTNLNPKSLQGDKVLANFLQDMGTSVTIKQNSVKVEKSRLKAIKADLTDCIDLLPTMAVLAAVADGASEFSGIARARLKESDRVAAVKEGLERMGVKVVAEKNRLIITGSKPHGAIIDSQGDHRIAMAFSLLGTLVGDTTIEGAECVAKTYPEFWETLKSLGGRVEIDGQ
jgi:3-phosphoshikimate 1-carboxyvinyltransferase